MTRSILQTAVIFSLLFSHVSAAEAPAVTELERLRVTVLVREYELAEAKMIAAQKDLDAARLRVVEKLKLMDVSAPEGFTFDLGTMAYVVKK